MRNKKYRLLRGEQILPGNPNWQLSNTKKAHRIQALRDIPEHGVKKGDVGGYISTKETLSQEGSCWVAYDAQAIGNVFISDDAYLGDKAFLGTDFENAKIFLKESAKITGNAKVVINKFPEQENKFACVSIIKGNAHFFGNSKTYNLEEASGEVQVYGNAQLLRVNKISGETKVYGDAIVQKGCIIGGKSEIFENAVVDTSAVVKDCIVKGKAHIGEKEDISNEILEEEAIFRAVKKTLPEILLGELPSNAATSNPSVTTSADIKTLNTKADRTVALFEKIRKDIASYETDIVKIIKYPVMTDRTDVYTMEMVIALSNAESLYLDSEDPEFKEAVAELQKKFLAAESNALKIAATMLSDEDRRKAHKAKDLLAIAADEGSSENEKKISFKQAFKQLEGVLVVPEIAVDTFRVKIGLQELEM